MTTTHKEIIEKLKKKFFDEFDKNFYKDVEIGTRGGVAVALIWKEHPTEAKILLNKMFDSFQTAFLTKLTQVSKEAEEKAKREIVEDIKNQSGHKSRLKPERMKTKAMQKCGIEGAIVWQEAYDNACDDLLASFNPSPEACRCVCHVRGTKWRLNGFVYDKTCNHCEDPEEEAK